MSDYRGALDPTIWQNYLDAGVRLFHLSPLARAERILREGIRPYDAGPGHLQADAIVAPRSGFIYACTQTHWLEWVLEGKDAGVAVVVEIDPRQIAAHRLAPDEDLVTTSMGGDVPYDQFGIAADWDPDTGEALSAWAERMQVGTQPGIVEATLDHGGKVAIFGAIPPAHVRIADWQLEARHRWQREPDESQALWETRTFGRTLTPGTPALTAAEHARLNEIARATWTPEGGWQPGPQGEPFCPAEPALGGASLDL